MRRLSRGVVAILGVILVAFVFQRLFGNETVTPRLVSSQPVALIGGESGEPVAVAADGTVLAWFPVPGESNLPQLPLDAPPKGSRVEGPALEQVRVLGAAPPALRPYVEGSYYGESGVDVELTSGIELRFGNATQAARKWRAAAAVLADPTRTALDYVNLHAPTRPNVGGSGHTLPPIP
ncbi:MAG TPA: cell division protein FtsQ/DivIB [Solirubrobacterales bacterium]|nr:cell division protein FtsQ/DivIB [Solirubrobacterales bacterium]